MAQRPGWSRQELLETGMQFTDELVRASRKPVDELVAALRREVQRRVQVLGIATKDDVERLERRVRATEKAGRHRARDTAGKDTAKRGPAKNDRAKAGTKKPSGSS
jgi:hypothetical protein